MVFTCSDDHHGAMNECQSKRCGRIHLCGDVSTSWYVDDVTCSSEIPPPVVRPMVEVRAVYKGNFPILESMTGGSNCASVQLLEIEIGSRQTKRFSRAYRPSDWSMTVSEHYAMVAAVRGSILRGGISLDLKV